MVYVKPDSHPQMKSVRARIEGITPIELMENRIEFEDLYALEFESSVEARAAFEKLMDGVQRSMRHTPELSVIPAMSVHYRMDAASRTYALGAHRADMPLILSSFD